MANQTTATGSLWLPAYWDKVFLDEARAAMVMYDLGMKSQAQSNMGTTVHWLVMADLTGGAALSESFDPTESSLSAGDKSATIAEYGDVVKISTLLKQTSISSWMEQLIERIGRSAAVGLDTTIRNGVMSAASCVKYGLSAVARSSIDTNTGNDFSILNVRKAVNFFQNANVKPLSDGSYAAIIHPDVTYDLQGDANWEDAHIYTDKGITQLYNGEVGKLYGVRFLQTTQALLMDASGSASTDVYQSYFIANQGFGVSELYQPRVIIKDPNPGSTLDTWASVGWKAGFAYKALGPSALLRYETGSSLGT